MYVCVYMHLDMCVYAYIYIGINIRIYICIYTQNRELFSKSKMTANQYKRNTTKCYILCIYIYLYLDTSLQGKRSRFK